MKPQQAALAFLLLATLSSTVWLSVLLCGELVWVDFVRSNPHRPQSNAAFMMLLSPLYGLFGTLVWNLMAILVASAAIAFVVLIFRRVWWPAYVVIVGFCSYLTVRLWVGTINVDGNAWELVDTLWRVAMYQAPTWLLSWIIISAYFPNFFARSVPAAAK